MQTVIFDMDGLLIDSEPLWREAEMAVFESVGLHLTEELCHETTGLRVDEVVRYWHRRFPWSGPNCELITKQLLDAVQRLIVERGALMEGARDVVTELHSGGVKLAIASSSPMYLIRTVVERFSLGACFSVLHSAEHEVAGKPDPAVYLTTMSLLGADPHQCIALEDSLAGVRAAKAAGATVVAIPATEDTSDPEFAVADVILTSLKDFSLDLVRTMNTNKVETPVNNC